MNPRTHAIPLGGTEPIHHASLDCWCHPLSTDNGALAVHNAKDVREKWERQGILDSNKSWALVNEGPPNPAVSDAERRSL